jgi:excisionase family DNA binding protein
VASLVAWVIDQQRLINVVILLDVISAKCGGVAFMGQVGRPREQAPLGYFTVQEAADRLGVSYQAIHKRIQRGTLPFEEVPTPSGGHRLYIPQAAVEEALTKNSEPQHVPEYQGDRVDMLAAHLDALSERQKNFEQTVREFLTTVREEPPMLRSDKQQHDEKERFRELLVEFLNFLNQDEANTYKHTLARDALREKISSVLYKQNGSKGYSPNVGE